MSELITKSGNLIGPGAAKAEVALEIFFSEYPEIQLILTTYLTFGLFKFSSQAEARDFTIVDKDLQTTLLGHLSRNPELAPLLLLVLVDKDDEFEPYELPIAPDQTTLVHPLINHKRSLKDSDTIPLNQFKEAFRNIIKLPDHSDPDQNSDSRPPTLLRD